MRLSIFTTHGTHDQYGDKGEIDDASIACYKDLADEVVVVVGGPSYTGTKYNSGNGEEAYYSGWRREFSWEFIGEQFQRGYEFCTGDVVIHADLDFIFHENDHQKIREAAEALLISGKPAASFYKYQFIQPDRYNLKSRLVLMVNKRDYGERIRFDSGGDLCQPSLDGIELKPEHVPESKIAFYNYEKLRKTKEQITDDVGRMARAWQKRFGEYKLGGPDDKSAYDKWLKMTLGRYGKPQKQIELFEHPKYIRETIANLTPEQWGYNGHGNLKENNYV